MNWKSGEEYNSTCEACYNPERVWYKNIYFQRKSGALCQAESSGFVPTTSGAQ